MCNAVTRAGKPCRLVGDPWCHVHGQAQTETERGRREELLEHVDRLDRAAQLAKPNELAAILRERRITLATIEELKEPSGESIIDQLSARRAARRAAAGME